MCLANERKTWRERLPFSAPVEAWKILSADWSTPYRSMNMVVGRRYRAKLFTPGFCAFETLEGARSLRRSWEIIVKVKLEGVRARGGWGYDLTPCLRATFCTVLEEVAKIHEGT